MRAVAGVILGALLAFSFEPLVRAGGDKAFQPRRTATLGVIGRASQGATPADRLARAGHQVIAAQGLDPGALRAVVDRMPAGRRVLWLDLGAKDVDQVVATLTPMLARGDVIVDGGRSRVGETVQRAEALARHGIHLVDVGQAGYAIGGEPKVVRRLGPVFRALAGSRAGWGRVGAQGAGHRAEMIHDAILKGMVDSLSEGLRLAASGTELRLDPAQLTRIWRDGSVVSSQLVDRAAAALRRNPSLGALGGTGRDPARSLATVEDAVGRDVPIPLLAQSLLAPDPAAEGESFMAEPGARRGPAGDAKPFRPRRPATLGMIGLGRMGGAMTRRLLAGGHHVIAYDPNAEARAAVAQAGAVDAESLRAVVDRMPAGHRVVWVMVAAEATEKVIAELGAMLAPGDVIIDGGNSNYHDTVRRGADLARVRGIHVVDVGTSGGVWGETRGYSLMVGGEGKVVRGLTPIFQTLAPGARTGWGHVGATGAGHRAKMIHNGIEYGMMAALAEGLHLASSPGPLRLEPVQIAQLWRGGKIGSWLLDLAADGLRRDPTLSAYGTVVPDSGEGRWTVDDAVARGVPLDTISKALWRRFASQQGAAWDSFKVEGMLRYEFGRHVAPAAGKAQ